MINFQQFITFIENSLCSRMNSEQNMKNVFLNFFLKNKELNISWQNWIKPKKKKKKFTYPLLGCSVTPSFTEYS